MHGAYAQATLDEPLRPSGSSDFSSTLAKRSELGRRMSFILGLDLGQAPDYTALAVGERTDSPIRYDVRHLHRFPLGTAYPAIAEHVADLLCRPPLTGYVPVVVDATGVGAPVVDLLTRQRLGPIAVKIHGGQSVVRDDDGAYRVPKRDLASVVAVLLQDGRLRVAQSLRESQRLITEMLAFKAKITVSSNDTYEARRERDHDDLVLAVALACWYGEHHAGIPVFGGHFSVDFHVSKGRVTPEVGLPIIRDWRTTEPPTVVWFQIDRDECCRMLYEQPPEAGRGLVTMKGLILNVSGVLFPGFQHSDFGEIVTEPNTSRTTADLLRPEIMLRQGENTLVRRLEAARRWMGKAVEGKPALQIDPGCEHLIRPLQGGYVYRRVRGQGVDEPEDNAHGWIVDAWLSALATPAATMTELERQAIGGPKVLRPTWA